MSKWKEPTLIVVGFMALSFIAVGKYAIYVPFLFLGIPAFLLALVAVPLAKYNKVALWLVYDRFNIEGAGYFLNIFVLSCIALLIYVVIYMGTIGGMIFTANQSDYRYTLIYVGPEASRQANARFLPYLAELTTGYISNATIMHLKKSIIEREMLADLQKLAIEFASYIVLIAIFSFGFIVVTPILLDADGIVIWNHLVSWIFEAFWFPVDVVKSFQSDPNYIWKYVANVIKDSKGNMYLLTPIYPKFLVMAMLISFAFNVPRVLFSHHGS